MKKAIPRDTTNKLLNFGDKEKNLQKKIKEERYITYRGTKTTTAPCCLLEKMQAKR